MRNITAKDVGEYLGLKKKEEKPLMFTDINKIVQLQALLHGKEMPAGAEFMNLKPPVQKV